MKIFIALILLIVASCKTGAPMMDRKVKIWNGAPEEGAICRLSTPELASATDRPVLMLKMAHQGIRKGQSCISAFDPDFAKYGCLTFDDIGVLYDYIETLIYQCKKWK